MCTVYKQREVILPEKDGDEEKPGEWKEINQDRKAIRRIEKEHRDYEEKERDVTYRVIVDREREIILPEKAGDSEKPGAWREVSNRRIPVRKIEKESKDYEEKDGDNICSD